MNAELQCLPAEAAVPQYLAETYWWAYVHPRAVYLFERQWLVNLILWGNFNRLRDAAIGALGAKLGGRTLQVACVYGDLTRRIAARLTPRRAAARGRRAAHPARQPGPQAARWPAAPARAPRTQAAARGTDTG